MNNRKVGTCEWTGEMAAGGNDRTDTAQIEGMSKMDESLLGTELALAGLLNSLDLLTEKLKPVCQPNLPDQDFPELKRSPEHSMVVSRILAHNYAIDRFTLEMKALRDAVEV